MQYRTASMAEGVFYTFWFEKDLQGDIVAIYNSSGTKVFSHTYDSWGNFTMYWINSSGTNYYASYNPFTYRGYYFDSELGMYYLQSRYYDPAIGRFINADISINANGDILGFNMFAYCGSNPVMGYDPEGLFNWGKLLAITVVAIVVVASVAATVATFGAGSVAGTIAISAAISITAKATEVAVLQGKNSIQDGDGIGEMASDIVDSLFDNGLSIIGLTPVTKAVGFGTGFFSQSLPFQESLDLMKEDGFSVRGFVSSAWGELVERYKNISEYMSISASASGMVFAYLGAAYSVANAVCSWFSDDPLDKAEQRRIKLR